jgi:hypothetical protein
VTRPPRARGPLTAAFTLLAALLLGTFGTAPAAALPATGDALLVDVTALDPLFPSPGDRVTVSGTVTNRSGQRVEGLSALLRVSPEPLTSRSEVAAVTDLTTVRRGVTQGQTLTPVADSLAAGASTTFAITVPADELPLGGNGVYAVFAEVRSAGMGSFDTAFPLPWFPRPDDLVESRIVVLAPVRAAVDLTATHTLQSPGLMSSMAPGGALHTLAAAGTRAAEAGVPVSWLIDPAVTAAAAILGAQEGTFPASITDPAAAADSVSAWLTTLAQGTASPTSSTYLAPYAEVDASGVLQAGMPDLLTDAIERSTALVGAAPPPDAAPADPLGPARGVIAIGPGGNSTTASLTAYRDAGVGSIVLSAATVPPVEQLPYTPSGVAAIPLPEGASITGILPDQQLRADLQRPAATAADQFRMRQGLLADAAMITLELPVSPRTVVLALDGQLDMAPDVLAGSLTALGAAPFTEVVPLAALAAADVPRVERRTALEEEDPGRLPGEYLAPIPPLQQRLAAFARVTVDPLVFAEDYRTAILRSASANWRPDLPKGQALLSAVEAELSAEEQKVTTVSTGTVTFSGNSGNLPLTISNGLEQAVEVGVQLRAEPSVRLAYAPPPLVQVDAGKRVSVEIPVEVYGTGPLPVSVVLTDRDGNPFISTADLVIRSAATAAAAAVVALIGAVAFLFLVIWRFRKKGAADS